MKIRDKEEILTEVSPSNGSNVKVQREEVWRRRKCGAKEEAKE
jgi:hypothetical protein